MKKIFLIFSFFVMIVFIKNASATTWVPVSFDPTNFESWYIDGDSVEYESSNIFHAFFKKNTAPDFNPMHRRKVVTSILLISFKNSGKLKFFSIDSATDYNSFGEVVNSFSIPNHNWTPIVPNSIGESLYSAAASRL